MKFSTGALLLATLGYASAGKKLTKKAFLRNVLKVDKQGATRRLDEEFAIAAEDSLKFQKCVSITLGPDQDTAEDLFDNYYEYTQAGTLASTIELAMFSVCDYSAYADDDGANDDGVAQKYCHYGGDDGDDELYMTPLGNWLENTAYAHLNQVENYCEACRQSQEFCEGGNEEEAAEEEEGENEEENQDENQDENQEEQEGEEEGEENEEEGEQEEGEEGEEEGDEEQNDEGRRLKSRKLANYVDCDTCDAMGCFEEEERRLEQEGQQEEEQDIAEYIQQFVECQQIEDQDGGDGGEMQLFASWCCNADGDGVRMCLYVDENCAVKYTGDSYYNLYGANEQAYSDSKEELGYALNYPVSCQGEIEYDELGNDDQQDEQQDEQQEQAEAAEFCQNLINNNGNYEEGAEVIALSDCAYDGDQEEQNGDEEEADYGGYDYWYQVEANDAQNFQQLCYEVQNLNGEGYWTTDEYDESTYDPDTSNSSFNGLSTGAEVAIALVVLAVVAILGFVAWKCCTKSKDADEKEFHLVDDRKGSLA